MKVKEAIDLGYFPVRRLPNGMLAGVRQQLFTAGLFVGITESQYSRRYCYEDVATAVAALVAWDGVCDPPGPWIKEKPSDRLGPGATK